MILTNEKGKQKLATLETKNTETNTHKQRKKGANRNIDGGEGG